MTREVQAPECTQRDTLHGDTYQHPAFATISASRISGQADLFGSNIGHNGFVQIEISEATLNRDGMHDRIHGSGRIITRLYLSEAQWVAFISRMNVGSGTPCTLRLVRSGPLEQVPGLPPQEKPALKLNAMVRERQQQEARWQQEQIDKVRTLCEGLPAKKRTAILDALRLMTQHLVANHEYQHKVLTEKTETLVTEAKVEIDAMLTEAVRTLGIDSIQQLAQLADDASARIAARLPSPIDAPEAPSNPHADPAPGHAAHCNLRVPGTLNTEDDHCSCGADDHDGACEEAPDA